MEMRYCLFSPTGNDTVLVETPVPRARHAAVAARLLSADGVGGEQVGFIEPAADPAARKRLQMMGGEFCGNASMSLGAWLARQDGLADGASAVYRIEVSGCEDPVEVRIVRTGEAWRGTVQMPLPESIESCAIDTDDGLRRAPLVRMPGIAHLILPLEWGLGEPQLRRRLPGWNRQIGADALGALIWDAATSAIDPIVYVPSADTLVREHGCGSGTAAIGAWLARSEGRSLRAVIRQPGGEIAVDAEVQGQNLRALSITGMVRLLTEGAAQVG